MQLIKYKNRKLYSYDEKKYVTLDLIYDKLKEGVNVTVIDKNTGADVTAECLAEVIVKIKPSAYDLANFIRRV